jgi:A-factor biosynthesis hotdog protein
MTLAYRSTIGETSRDEVTGSWSAPLVVDDSDPVIFDHRVDHLPGMLMLHGIAELLERAYQEPDGRTAGSMDLVFTRFGEKDRPALVTIRPASAPHTWQVELTQSAHAVCSGTVQAIALADRARSTVVTAAAAVELADAALVHRSRPENIVVSALRASDGGYTVDYVPSEFVRTKRFAHVHGPLDIVEAARQFMILLSHTACGFALGTRLILTRLAVSVPRLFPRAATVRLHSAQPRVDRHRLDFTIHARCGNAPAATITWDIKAVTPAVYARLRGGPNA